MKIEWASHFHSDGTRRNRLPPSTMHGWLAKMRGTLIGDEHLRSKGMREMREAKAHKIYIAKKKKQANGGRSLFSFFGFGRPVKSRSPIVISKRKSSLASPTYRSRGSTSSRGTRPSARSQSARSPGNSRTSARTSARPSPRHRDSTRSYRMPGHYDLSQRQPNRRATH